jgi:antimicrobial peptide system SdpB family protein
MIDSLGEKALAWCRQVNPWGNVVGVARSLIALSTTLTLLLNAVPNLFRPGSGIPGVPVIVGFGKYSLFALLAPHLELARWIAIALLIPVLIGWRPRFTGLIHWWVTFSLAACSINIDGGDQIGSLLTLLLIPVTLTDGRKWHWTTDEGQPAGATRLLALSSLLMIRLQVAAIYFHSSVAKMKVEEWVDGTATYYWFTNPAVGAAPVVRRLIDPFLLNGVTVALLTWGAMAFELLLFMALIMPKRYWQPLLLAGIAFHFMIAVIHGLVSFSTIMSAALILYLRPHERPFPLAQLAKKWQNRFSMSADTSHVATALPAGE